MVVEGRDAPRNRLAEGVRFSHIASESAVSGDAHVWYEQKPEIGIANRSCHRVGEPHHRLLRYEEISIFNQFYVETRGTIGAL